MNARVIVLVAAVLTAALSYFVFRAAARSLQNARRYPAYAMRRRYKSAALRWFILAALMFFCAILLPAYGTPLAEVYFPLSPTPSLTATPAPLNVIVPPTESAAPAAETATPSAPVGPTATVTPFIPVAIEAMFQGLVTPNPEAVFTEIQFSTKFDGVNPIDPQKTFRPPIETMYGGFDYNNLVPETQWTALWYRDGNLICYETKPWDGGTGGMGGYTECKNPFGGWQPGNYEVQLFMGYELKKIGRFVVLANPTPTAKP